MAYVFRPPVVCDMPWILPETTGVQYRLFRYYGPICRGMSVVKINGEYVTVDYPSQDILTGQQGVDWFLGGHTYIIRDAVAEALIADGYGGSPEAGEVVEGVFWGDYSDNTWSEVENEVWEEM